MDHNASAIIHY